MSHISGCATIRTAGSDTQSAITGGWLPPRRRPAIGLTILPSSHSPSVISGISTVKPSQAMGAVAREPREGEIPVELTSRQPFDDFPQQSGVSRTNRIVSLYTVKRQDESDETKNVLSLTDLNSVLLLDLYIGGNA